MSIFGDKELKKTWVIKAKFLRDFLVFYIGCWNILDQNWRIVWLTFFMFVTEVSRISRCENYSDQNFQNPK